METSILEELGLEIIGVMAPVSICMFLVVLLVYTIVPQGSESSPISSAATLVYLEKPTDSNTEKLEGALLNAVVFVILIAAVTFVLVLLYYYRCTNFLKNYMRFSTFIILGSMGGSIFLSIIQHFSIPLDVITCSILLYNFSVVGVLSVFSGGVPILVRQIYMVVLGITVAAWFTKLPEWTTWVILVALALYDLVAVLAPGGPLKLLVELASSRDEELPALVYEARPTVSRREDSALNLLVAGVSASAEVREENPRPQVRPAVELQPARTPERVIRSSESVEYQMISYEGHASRDRDTGHGNGQRFGNMLTGSTGMELERTDDEESPLVSHNDRDVEGGSHRIEDGISELSMSQGIKLGLGDFVFYSVLVGRAAMYDLMTVYACYIAIICGLGCTLVLLSICRHALPALPISIALGVIFYFMTRLLMEPFIVGTSTRLMMF
ncbi:unnamed protein product [Victoria cruziana]